MTTRQTALRRTVFAGMLLFDLYIAGTVFYSPIDDWQWSMDTGIWWLETGVLNGRYMGNLFAVVMTRLPWLKTLSMALCMFALPYFMARLAARGRRERVLPLFVACNAGILLMPSVMWRETYFWVSGFGNFVVPTTGALLLLLLLRRLDRVRAHWGAWSALLFVYLLGLGLFLENLTVLFTGACLLALLLAQLRDKPFRLPALAMLAGSLLAAWLMLSNGIFTDLAETGEAVKGYRQLSFSLEEGLLPLALDVLRQYVWELLPRAFILGPHLAWPIAVITFFGFWHGPFRPACALALFPVVHNLAVVYTDVYVSLPGTIASCISWSLPLLALALQRADRTVRFRRLLLFLAAPLSLLPLAVTSSLVHRHFFFPMVLLILLAADEAQEVLCRRWGWAAPVVLLLAMTLRWGVPCWTVRGCTQLREEIIAQARETQAREIVLPADRYQYAIWSARDPWDVEKSHYFCQIYGFPDDITLVILPGGTYESWPDITPEQWEGRLELHPSPDFIPFLPVP